MLNLIILGTLIFVLVTSFVFFRLQMQQRKVRKRLSLVAARACTHPKEHKRLFGWEWQYTPLKRWLMKTDARVDALFGVKGKKWLVGSLVLLAGLVWNVSGFMPSGIRVILSLAAPATLFVIGYWVLRSRQIKQFEKAFPQVLGQISRAVAAGVSVPQAITQVADHQHGLLGDEFSLIRDKLEIGIELKQALEEANHRMPYSGFHFFTVALILNQENGGQLRDVLHSLSRTMHDSSALKMKIKSLTAEPRMTALILACLPLFLIGFMFLQNPSSFEVLTDTKAGQYVLMYVVSSMAVGLGIIHFLTKVRS